MDLDVWDCFEQETAILQQNFMGLINIFRVILGEEIPSNSRVNTVEDFKIFKCQLLTCNYQE